MSKILIIEQDLISKVTSRIQRAQTELQRQYDSSKTLTLESDSKPSKDSSLFW